MNLVYDRQNKVYYLATWEYYGVQNSVKDGYKKGNTYVVNGKYESPLYNEQEEEVNTFTLTLEKMVKIINLFQTQWNKIEYLLI